MKLLTVAGNEGNGVPLVQQLYHVVDLLLFPPQLPGQYLIDAFQWIFSFALYCPAILPQIPPPLKTGVFRPHKVIQNKKADTFVSAFLARRKGFEPLTFWSVARRSIQLS